MGMNANMFNYQDKNNLKKLQMDIEYTNMQFFSLKKANSKQVFLTAMQSSDYRLKAAACLMAFDYDFEYLDDLIDAVSSSDIVVNQSARISLVRLSNKILCGEEQIKRMKEEAAKKDAAKSKSIPIAKSKTGTQQNNSHYVDFGPNIHFMGNDSLNACQNLWKVWFNEKTANQKKSNN